jgi:Flp pilus assembly protein TadG
MRNRIAENLSSFIKSSRASLTVELVVTFPILIAALAFAYEFGRYYIAQHDTVNNVREASRYLSRVANPTDPTVITTVENMIKTGSPSGGFTPSWMEDATITIDPDWGSFTDPAFREDGNIIRITVVANFPVQLLGFIGTSTDRASIGYAVQEEIRHIGD